MSNVSRLAAKYHMLHCFDVCCQTDAVDLFSSSMSFAAVVKAMQPVMSGSQVRQVGCIAEVQVIEITASSKIHHRARLLASQANGFVQQLGHLLVVGMVLPPGAAGNEAVVLQLGHVLLRESLHTCTPVLHTQSSKDIW